jgi:hypothetical protein
LANGAKAPPAEEGRLCRIIGSPVAQQMNFSFAPALIYYVIGNSCV